MTVPHKVDTVSTIRYEDNVDEVDVMDAEGAEAR